MSSSGGCSHEFCRARSANCERSPFSEQRLRTRRVKDELRENLDRKTARQAARFFPGSLGMTTRSFRKSSTLYCRGTILSCSACADRPKAASFAPSRPCWTNKLPYIAGCEIHDNPYDPICRRCRDLVSREGDATPIAYLNRDDRYVEKLATPDVTIADLIGDIDPIKAARGGQELRSEFTVHYGLLPRANRGIFAINELPDLAGKIQVGLFNIMQEGDVQIKGYPIRLPLDVAACLQRQSRRLYGARQDHHSAEGPHRNRDPHALPGDRGRRHRDYAQEAWIEAAIGERIARARNTCSEVIEQHRVRCARRQEDRQALRRQPASADFGYGERDLERRTAGARITARRLVVPRVGDIYAALPAITGKLELEYEGEMKGADAWAAN